MISSTIIYNHKSINYLLEIYVWVCIILLRIPNRDNGFSIWTTSILATHVLSYRNFSFPFMLMIGRQLAPSEGRNRELSSRNFDTIFEVLIMQKEHQSIKFEKKSKFGRLIFEKISKTSRTDFFASGTSFSLIFSLLDLSSSCLLFGTSLPYQFCVATGGDTRGVKEVDIRTRRDNLISSSTLTRYRFERHSTTWHKFRPEYCAQPMVEFEVEGPTQIISRSGYEITPNQSDY